MISFSIIVPVLNRAGFIRRALDSVLGQSFENFEIVVVDNGSTDGTLAILMEYEARGEIVLFSCVNRGVSYARNVGISRAKSDFICVLDSDNYFSTKDSLWTLYELISSLDFSVEVILTSNVNENGEKISFSPLQDTVISNLVFLKTSGEFSITARREWFLKNLHPEIPGVTHEILFPAIYKAACDKMVFLSSLAIQTYSESASDRISSKELTSQQIVNYQYFFRKVLDSRLKNLPLYYEFVYNLKFHIYNKLSHDRIIIFDRWTLVFIGVYFFPDALVRYIVKLYR